MPFGPDDEDDDVLELTEDQQLEPGADDDADGDDGGAGDDDDNDGGEEETVIAFEDEEPGDGEAGDQGSSVIRTLRAELKERNKRIRELEQSTPAAEKIEVGDKPTLAGCNYDEDAYEQQLEEWKERAAAVEAQTAEAAEQAKAINESWAEAKRRYDDQAAEHGFTDIKDDEALVDAALGRFAPVILKATTSPALMVRALGRSPTKLAELAKIKDPFELAATIARMEGTVKVVKRRKGPAIDKPQQGSGKTPASGDKAKQLEKLEKEAERTGERTELQRFKKKHGLK